MKKDFNYDFVRSAWKNDIDSFDYSPAFKKYVNDLLAE